MAYPFPEEDTFYLIKRDADKYLRSYLCGGIDRQGYLHSLRAIERRLAEHYKRLAGNFESDNIAMPRIVG